jgi:TPR repeat protein
VISFELARFNSHNHCCAGSSSDSEDLDDSAHFLSPGQSATAFKADVTNDPEAQFRLGEDYHLGRNGVENDLVEAVSLFQLSAAHGHAGAQNKLGVFYSKGDGLPRDEQAAVKFTALAADQGHAEAQFNLGYFHEAGRGTLPKNLPEALRLYRLAAAQGHKLAPTKVKQVMLKM